MATNLLKIHIQSTIITPKINFNYLKNPSLTTLLRNNNSNNNSSNNKRLTSFYSPKIKLFTINSSLSSSPTPPISKDDAILQAKTSLSAALQKPLNNPKLAGKIKKQKQARFRVEIPVIDDSPESLARLVFEIFGNNQVKRRGATVKMLLVWPNANTLGIGIRVFEGMSNGGIEHVELNSVMTVDNRILNSADVAVFLAPNSSQLTVMKLVSDNVDPRPLVLFNPKWAFEDEEGFGGSRNFVGSFDVIYAFLGLEVRGLLSKRKGVVFKFVRDGVVSGENWNVLVEEEEDGNRLKVVSRFKTRPSIIEVENVLYNLMAVNSPITKSAKFLKNLVSNVTGKKSS